MNFELTGRGGKLQCTEADVVQGLVVQDHALVSILNKLMHRKGGIVWFDNCVRNLGRRKDRKCQHHAIWILLPDLGNKKGSHSRARSSTQRMTDLKSCSKTYGVRILQCYSINKLWGRERDSEKVLI